MAGRKSGNPQMGAYLQMLLLEWLQTSGLSEAEFARRAKLSRGAINQIKNGGRGGGDVTVEGFALALGKSKVQLYADAERWGSTGKRHEQLDPGVNHPRLGDLSGWQEAEAQARDLFKNVSSHCWDLAAGMMAHERPKQITPAFVYKVASIWAGEELQQAIDQETAEVRAELEHDHSRDLEERRRIRERDKTPAPPPSSSTAKRVTGNR